MKRFRVSVHIVPRKGILDPQGKAVADALHTLGFASVTDVHVGRFLVIEANAGDAAVTAGWTDQLLVRNLANGQTVIVTTVAHDPVALVHGAVHHHVRPGHGAVHQPVAYAHH